MQTILGAGGSIGNDLAKELTKYTKSIRLVSRNPVKVNSTDETFKCDLLDSDQVKKAVANSSIVYLVAGLKYKASVWEAQWPVVMKNVIDACKLSNARLAFFDNVYSIDPGEMGNINEHSKVAPVSKKGQVRKLIAEMILKEVGDGNLKALIARAPDFYGPAIKNGPLNLAVLSPMLKGKKANWFCSVDKIHTFMWTPDGAKGLAILGNDDKAYGEIWHLPTTSEKWTVRQYINAFADYLDVKPKYQVAGKTMTRILGLFDPTMKEFVEMLYQYDRDYIFSSSKFEKAYDFKPTPIQDAIKLMLEAEMNKQA